MLYDSASWHRLCRQPVPFLKMVRQEMAGLVWNRNPAENVGKVERLRSKTGEELQKEEGCKSWTS